MRRGKQIIFSILITLALLALAWSAGSGRTREKTTPVLAAKCDIPAGTQISAEQLVKLDLPESLFAKNFITSLDNAVGQWTTSAILSGELLSRQRLTMVAGGIDYPNPGPDRRLLTIDLEPAEAVGYWLSAGSLVDLYLVPRNQDNGIDLQILEKVRIMRIITPASAAAAGGVPADTGNASGLICLDLSSEQARIIINSRRLYDVVLSAINEADLTMP